MWRRLRTDAQNGKFHRVHRESARDVHGWKRGHSVRSPKFRIPVAISTAQRTTADGIKPGRSLCLKRSGSGYVHTIIHNFGKDSDGAHPYAGVIDASGVLYGTTIGGGTYKRDLCKTNGGSPDGTCGTVYRIDLATGQESVIHSFGAGDDGASPYSGVIGAVRYGTLYGTTVLGESNSYCGTVYSLTLSSGEEHILHNFGGSPDGCKSYGGVAGSGGSVYGTTSEGGENWCYQQRDGISRECRNRGSSRCCTGSARTTIIRTD